MGLAPGGNGGARGNGCNGASTRTRRPCTCGERLSNTLSARSRSGCAKRLEGDPHVRPSAGKSPVFLEKLGATKPGATAIHLGVTDLRCPPKSYGDLAFVQHMIASLNTDGVLCLEKPPWRSFSRWGGSTASGPDPTTRTEDFQMLTVETMPVSELRPYKGNARTHSKKQVRQIANSITEFGFNNPILIGDDREIIAGHGRVEAAKLTGLKEVPTVRLSHLSPAQRSAYVIRWAPTRILMAGEKADMVFTDPPYNVPIRGHVSGLGAVKHDEFAMASGEMDRVQVHRVPPVVALPDGRPCA